MDEDRQRLERAFKAAPDDERAARAYHAALLRAGERAAVREAYAFKFQCSLRWSALTPTEDTSKKHCGECNRDVHFVATMPLLREHVAAGHCVAVAEGREISFVDGLLDEPRLHGAADDGAPCIVLVDGPQGPDLGSSRVVMGGLAPRPQPAPPERR